MNRTRRLALAIAAACSLGCGDAPTSSGRDIADSEIEELMIFVRDWPDEYVEIALRRSAGQSTLLIFRPPQPGIPRILIDSIGPGAEDPPEIVQLLSTFDVWAMADSNAVGAACNTRSGQWVCRPTANDYSVVIGVTGGGMTRAQRYTRLRESTSSRTARALGDFVLEMARKREARARATVAAVH